MFTELDYSILFLLTSGVLADPCFRIGTEEKDITVLDPTCSAISLVISRSTLKELGSMKTSRPLLTSTASRIEDRCPSIFH
ncbi:hypothetical protein M3Y95_00826100 [Aphelenchoides besseyi]|nr:hypothetical protein M3Y95_00826100 [Aphelenchoides besseyi]